MCRNDCRRRLHRKSKSKHHSLAFSISMARWDGCDNASLLILSRVLGGGMSLARAELTGSTMSQLGRLYSGQLGVDDFMSYILEFGMLCFIGGIGMFDAANYSLTTLPSEVLEPLIAELWHLNPLELRV